MPKFELKQLALTASIAACCSSPACMHRAITSEKAKFEKNSSLLCSVCGSCCMHLKRVQE